VLLIEKNYYDRFFLCCVRERTNRKLGLRDATSLILLPSSPALGACRSFLASSRCRDCTNHALRRSGRTSSVLSGRTYRVPLCQRLWDRSGGTRHNRGSFQIARLVSSSSFVVRTRFCSCFNSECDCYLSIGWSVSRFHRQLAIVGVRRRCPVSSGHVASSSFGRMWHSVSRSNPNVKEMLQRIRSDLLS
jgi:hypothetical protein